MKIHELDEVLVKQKEYFNSGITLDVKFRINMLKKLYNAIKNNEEKITFENFLEQGIYNKLKREAQNKVHEKETKERRTIQDAQMLSRSDSTRSQILSSLSSDIYGLLTKGEQYGI